MLNWLRPKRQMSEEDYNLRLLAKGLGPEGFMPDPVPIAPPIGYKRQPTMVEIVRNAVRSERLKLEAEIAGFETFDESEDFDVGDMDEMPRSQHEWEGQPTIAEMRQAVADHKAAEAARKPKDGGGGDPPADKQKPGEAPGGPE